MVCEPAIPPRSEGDQSDLDRILVALRHPRRRQLLYHLQETDSLDIEDAVTSIAAHEHNTDPDNLTDTECKPVLISLNHVHLPQLQDLGIVDYDQQSGAIRLHNPPAKLEPFLKLGQTLDETTKRD